MNILPLFIIVPLGGAFLVSLLGRRFKIVSDILANVTTAALVVLALHPISAKQEQATIIIRLIFFIFFSVYSCLNASIGSSWAAWLAG